MADIVDGLAARKTVVKLVLSHNAVGRQSCTALANLLQTSRVLQWLECHWGHIRKDGAEELAEALVSADQLKHLDLGWNGFGDLVPCRCMHYSASIRFDVVECAWPVHARAEYLLLSPLAPRGGLFAFR